MDRKTREHKLFRYILLAFALVLFTLAVRQTDNSAARNLIAFSIFLPANILMGTMVISLGEIGSIDLTDAVIAFIFINYGVGIGVIFTAIHWGIVTIIREKFIIRRNDNSRILFNISMFISAAYFASLIMNSISLAFYNSSFAVNTIQSITFVGLFLIFNIAIIKTDYSIETKKYYKFDNESIRFLTLNFAISSFLAITLCEVNETSQLIGTLLVLGNLIVLHYCFHIYRKFKLRNDAIKGLLKITGDIVKYGEFRDKCKHLIMNLKELIPYTICAIYTFDTDNDNITYPVAYNGTGGIGIGDIYMDLTSAAVTVKTVKEGKIHISRDIKKDRKVKFTGKIADIMDAVILVPVLVEEKVVGLILIGGDRNLINFVSKGIDDILNILSNQMALAIENDGIYRDMKNKADVDPLTRLYNRRVLDREINNLIASEAQFSLVMYDIDDFKKVNDSFGHLAGDEVLKMVSEVIRKSIRKTDVPCRYGGEEIIIIFKDLSKDDAFVISERIRNNIETTSAVWSGGNIFVTVSGGVSSYPEDGKSKEDIIKLADDILYSECKRKGKNRVCAYHYFEESAISTESI